MLDRLGKIGVPWRRVFLVGKVAAHRKLHLHGMDAFGRAAIGAGDPAAGEPPVTTCDHGLAAQRRATAASRAESQLLPALVPILNTGSSPENSRGSIERMEWQSYSTTRGCRARSRLISPASAR